MTSGNLFGLFGLAVIFGPALYMTFALVWGERQPFLRRLAEWYGTVAISGVWWGILFGFDSFWLSAGLLFTGAAAGSWVSKKYWK